MAIQIKNILGWKKGQRGSLSKVGVAKNTLALGKARSISILPAYDIVEETKDSKATVYIARTVETLLVRRAQMLQ
jgi:hypothetical protein